MYINSQNSIILEQENSWILTNPLLGYVFIVEISRVEYSLPDPSSLFSVHRYKKCAVAKIQPRTGQYKFSFSSSCIRSPKPLSLLKAANGESNSFALVHSKPSPKEELATSFHNRKFACDYNYSVTPYDLDHREFMRWLFIENKEHGGIFSPPLPECRLTQYLPLDPPCEESGRSIKVLQFPAKTLSRLFTYCSSAQTHWPCVSHNALGTEVSLI